VSRECSQNFPALELSVLGKGLIPGNRYCPCSKSQTSKSGNDSMKIFLPCTLLFALAALNIVAAEEQLAEAEPPVRSTLVAYIVSVDDEGVEQLTQATEVVPGQLVQYVLEYANVSEGAVEELRVIGPIPREMRYVADSADAPYDIRPEFSIDHGEIFSHEPVKYTVTLEDGETEERVATPDMYTLVRWQVPALQPEQILQFRYRALVQ
jgi:hypothetical protein